MGYTSLTLDFYHYYRDYSGSSAQVEVSIDGVNWTTVRTYTSSQGDADDFNHPSIDLEDDYINEPTFYVRFRYEASWGWYWAIDNVTLSGTSETPTISWSSDPTGTTFIPNSANQTVSPTETTTYTVTYSYPGINCPGTASTTVTVRPEPEVEITANYCTGNGKIQLTATGGLSSYLWSSGETTPSIEVDLAGFYEVTVTDANGCTGYGNITVSNNLVVNGDFDAGNTSFTTGYGYRADVGGQSELFPEGLYGVGPNANNYHTNFWGYDHTSGSGNFMIVNGNTNAGTPIWEQTVNVEPNTSYYFSAWAMSLNSAGNDAVLQFEVNDEFVGTPGRLPQGVSNNSNDGWIRFYSDVLWNSGSISGPITIRIKNIEPAAGGNDFGIDDISFGTLDATPFVATPTANSPCEGETLQLMANVSGGNEPIIYSWSGPNGFTSTEINPFIDNVTQAHVGTYTLDLVDYFNCPITAQVEVTINPVPTVTSTENTTTCSGTPFDFTASGMPAGTTYTWAAPTGSGFTGGSAQSSPQASVSQTLVNTTTAPVTATYLVTPTAGPCLGITFTLLVNIDPTATVDTGEPQQLCAGGSITLDGSIGGAATGATWSAPSGSFSDANSLTSSYTPAIGSGSVTLTLTTNNPDGDCPAVSSTVDITVTEPPVVSLVEQTNIKCKGEATGAIDVAVSGGLPPYRYFWNTGASSQDISNLTAGTYTLTVTDANDCTDELSVTITEPDEALTATISDVVNETCVETYNGKATVTASGGTGDYSYSWDTDPVQTNPTATLLASGTYTVTVTDDNGCIATADVTITIEVNTPPEITQCPAAIDIPACAITSVGGLNYSETTVEITEAQFTAAGGIATDNCGITHYYYSDTQSGACPIEVIRTFTVEDLAGLTDVCSQRITFYDDTAPTWTTDASDLDQTLDCDDLTGIAAAQALFPEADDNCDSDLTNIVKVSNGFIQGSCPQAGTYTNTWTVTDECGNTSEVYTQVITLVDNSAPSWTTIAGNLDRTISCNNAAELAAAQALYPTAVDNCDGNVTNITKSSGTLTEGSCPNTGTITNTWTVSDDCGNTSTIYTQVITVEDTEAPVWQSYEGELDEVVECSDAAGLAAASSRAPVASDDCGLDPSSLVKTPEGFVQSPDCPQSGTWTNTWTISDLCGNESAVYTQTITVVDRTAPTIVSPASTAIECSDSDHPDDTGWPYVYDNCSADAEISLAYSDEHVAGSCEGSYTIIRTWTATDECGNAGTNTQTITVQDVTAPVWTTHTAALNRSVSCDDPAALADAQALFPVATDNCDSDVSNIVKVSETFTPGSCSYTGTYTNIWSVTDDCGNTSAQYVQTIQVVDNDPPTLADPPDTYFCVVAILTALYDGRPEGLADIIASYNPIYEPSPDVLDDRPDYFVLTASDSYLDLDGSTYFSDNCSDVTDLTLHWTITTQAGLPYYDFKNNELTDIEGQISDYLTTNSTEIVFQGNDETIVIYNITYWLEDECGMGSERKTARISIQPRPQITKVNP